MIEPTQATAAAVPCTIIECALIDGLIRAAVDARQSAATRMLEAGIARMFGAREIVRRAPPCPA